jgi:hypothetical protein
MIRKVILAAVALVALSGIARGQQAAPALPSGHWIGAIEAGQKIDVEVDIGRQGEGWRGTISIPAQGAKGVPLGDITVKGSAVSFALKSVPGDPRFTGQLSADGRTLSGTFAQGGGSVPMSMTWKGEAQFAPPTKNKPVSKALLGTWEGTLDVKGTQLRLRLVLANGPDGSTGSLFSLDQGNVEIPVSSIAEDGAKLTLVIQMISGGYEGELKGDEIAGTWTQGPASFPLTFKRAK